MTKNSLKLFSVVTLVAFMAGCASSTVIKSNPTGADVYVDGAKVGKTPYTLTDSKLAFQSTTIQLKKDGYEDLTTVLPRFQELDVAAAVGGICVWPLWLWAGKYRAEQNYELERRR